MIEGIDISFKEALDLIGTASTVIALFFATSSFMRSSRIQEANFIKDMFEAFQRDRQAILTNPAALDVLAKERGKSQEKLIKESIGSFDINRAYMIHHLHDRRLLPRQRRKQDICDMRMLFADDLVRRQWQSIQTVYPKKFQRFIEKEIMNQNVE